MMTIEEIWNEVRDVQAQATEGFLLKEDVERALELYEEYGSKHSSCEVRAAASGADRRLTILLISSSGIEVSRGTTGRRYNTSRTGIHVQFDYYADEERELHEHLKDEGFGAHSKRKRFESFVGTNEAQHEVDLSAEPTEETLSSLFKINKHARKYAGKAENHYNRRNHSSAKRNSSKKKALYATKASVLSQLVDEVEKIERHQIGDREYYCLYFDEYSFHVRLNEINIDEDLVENGVEELEDFEKDADTGDMTRSLKASLIHLNETFAVNANTHLDPATVDGYFIGWSYLG